MCTIVVFTIEVGLVGADMSFSNTEEVTLFTAELEPCFIKFVISQDVIVKLPPPAKPPPSGLILSWLDVGLPVNKCKKRSH